MSASTSSDPSRKIPSARSTASGGKGLFTLCTFAVGLVLLGWGLFELHRAMESHRWPSTTGIIVRSEIHKVENRKESQTETTYYPRIHYRYAVFGKGYTADRVAFGGLSGGDQSKARKIVDRYPTGSPVTVFYDPDDPSVAVLKAGYRLQAYAIISAGLMVIAGGMFFFRRWRRGQARRNIYLGK